MKRVFIILTCDNKKECDKDKCEQKCEQKCEKQECEKQECEKKCEKEQCATKQCDKKQECKKEERKKECEKPQAGCIHLDAEGFAKSVADLTQPEWKYLGDKPAVVDFYADWCGPCRAIAPYLEEIAKEYAGKLYVYKINVDNNPELADAFNVTGIPTLLFIPMEGQYTVQVGGKSKEELEQLIAENCF